ncbi:MAG: hypothetical protein IJK01_09570 [Clostridia bacterium]|nr:hypothetical protein [Clostridia bacterium]
MVSIEKIREYATTYRSALYAAYKDGKFINDIRFRTFPLGCCGDTCYLLAEHLRRAGIETIWYSTERNDGSHAWLVVKDERVKPPTTKLFNWPEELEADLKTYGIEHPESGIELTNYEPSDFTEGIVIDITGDQFKDCGEAIFVGKADKFHQSFEFVNAHDISALNDERLCKLYRIVEEYL